MKKIIICLLTVLSVLTLCVACDEHELQGNATAYMEADFVFPKGQEDFRQVFVKTDDGKYYVLYMGKTGNSVTFLYSDDEPEYSSGSKRCFNTYYEDHDIFDFDAKEYYLVVDSEKRESEFFTKQCRVLVENLGKRTGEIYFFLDDTVYKAENIRQQSY